jgi:predicted transposase YbfD/YdcC
MNQDQYSSLLAALAAVPDPRQARGKRHDWSLILGVIASAVLSQQRSAAAIAHWVQSHTALLLTTFQPPREQLPSEATLRRALRHVDVDLLEYHLAHVRVSAPVITSSPTTPPAPPRGAAIDGKYVRGAGTHGCATLLVSLVTHDPVQVLTQRRAAPHQHESKAVAQLLTGRDLTGLVVTLDAGLTDAKLAQQILAQGGQYLMIVKRNQARLYEEITWYFDTPPLPCDRPWRTTETLNKGHGRLEHRRLTCTDDLDNYLTWPGVQQVLRRQCERRTLATGRVSQTVTYALTSLGSDAASAAQLEHLWRGHWSIENQVHYVRDVTLGEDAHQMHTGHAPQALATLRNAVLNQLRAAGWTNMATALRHYSYSAPQALQFIGLPVPGL